MRPQRRHRVFRFVRLALVALVVSEGLYIAAANAFLRLDGITKILASTNEIKASYARAWTLWPGRVHIKGARILFQDHNLQWSLDAKSLSVDVDLLPFLRKTIHATRVRGEGLVFRTRIRVLAADAMLPSTRALPPIPEFETPALVPAYVPGAPRTDLWTIHVENVDVGVVEAWVQQLRFLGKGRASGAFRLHAGQDLWVGPARFKVESGVAEVDHRVLAGHVSGHVDCVVHRFLVNDPVGREVLRNISANLDLHAQDVRLQPLDIFMPQGSTVVSPGARFDLVLGADHGVIGRGSHFELQGPELRGSYGQWALESGTFVLGARAAPAGQVTFRVEDLRASRGDNHASRLALGAGRVTFVSSSIDTSARWALARAAVVLDKLEIPALAGFDDVARPLGARLDSGAARLDAHGSYSGGTLGGEVRAVVSKGRGRVASVGWELDGSADLSVVRVRSEAPSVDSLDLDVQARRLAVTAAATHVVAKQAHVTARARLSEGRGSAGVGATAGKLSVRRGRLRVAGKLVAKLDLASIDLSKRAVRASATADLTSFAAASGTRIRGRARRFALKSEISLAGSEVPKGWVEILMPSLSFRAGNSTVKGDAQLFAEVEHLDMAKRRGTGHALVLVRDFSAINAADGVKCQRLSAPRAVLRTWLAFSPKGDARIDVTSELDAARARWDDFEVAGSATLRSRYLERRSDLVTLDVVGKNVTMKSGTGKLDGWDATFPELRITSRLRGEQGRLSGPIRARAAKIQARIGRTPVHGDLGVDLRFATLDLDRGTAMGSASVRVDHAGLDGPGLRVEDWWGRVEMPVLSLVTQDNLDLYGQFSAKLRDALPGLGVFAASGDLPGWVPALLPLRELEARGHFQRSCRTTDIVFEQASGGPLVAAGRIQSVPSDARAAFLLQLGSPLPLSVGLVTYGDSVGVALFAGNDWLAEQFKTLDGWATFSPCKAPPTVCSAPR